LYVSLYNASVKRDFEAIHTLQQKVMQISTTIYKVGHHGSSYLKGLKCSLSVMGLCNDFMAEPFHRFREPERLKINQLLEDLNYRELI
jgi:dihydrodipicolinate synthase/N-acetylneuraminate lyase